MKNKVLDWIINVAACLLLCGFEIDNDTISTVLFVIAAILAVSAVGSKICMSIKNKDINQLYEIDCEFFWTGFFAIAATLLYNHALNTLAVICGVAFLINLFALISTSIKHFSEK